MATKPAHVTPQPAVITRNASQQAFQHVIRNVIGDADHHIEWSLNAYGIDDLEGLLTLPVANIDNLQWQDPTANPPVAPANVMLNQKNMVKAFLAQHAHYSREDDAPIDVMTVTNDDFNQWRVSGYNHTAPIIPFAAPIPVPPIPPGPRGLTPAQAFDKGHRRDIKNYPELKSDDGWYAFQRKVTAAARLDKCENVLDPAYTPANAEETALFHAQNAYMMQVFECILLTSVGKNFVREHTGEDDGAQRTWRDMKTWARDSVAGEMAKEKHRAFLTSAKLDNSFRGTHEEWCIKWKDTVRKYNELHDAAHALPDQDCVQWFKASLSLSKAMSLVWTEIRNARKAIPAAGGHAHPNVDFNSYYEMCLERARELDAVIKRNARSSSSGGGPPTSRARRSVNYHDFDIDEEIIFGSFEDEEDREYLAAVHELSEDFGAFDIDDDDDGVQYRAFAAQTSPGRQARTTPHGSTGRNQQQPPRSTLSGNLDRVTHTQLSEHGKRKWDEFYVEDKIVITKGTRDRGALLFAKKAGVPYRLDNGSPIPLTSQRGSANRTPTSASRSPRSPSYSQNTGQRSRTDSRTDIFGEETPPRNTRGIRVQIADQSDDPQDDQVPELPSAQQDDPVDNEQRTSNLAITEPPSESYSADSEDNRLIALAKGEFHPGEMVKMLSQPSSNTPPDNAVLVPPGTPQEDPKKKKGSADDDKAWLKSIIPSATTPNRSKQPTSILKKGSPQKTHLGGGTSSTTHTPDHTFVGTAQRNFPIDSGVSPKYHRPDKQFVGGTQNPTPISGISGEPLSLEGEYFYTPESTPQRGSIQDDALDMEEPPFTPRRNDSSWQTVTKRRHRSSRRTNFHVCEETARECSYFTPQFGLKIIVMALAFALTFLIPSGESRLRSVVIPFFKGTTGLPNLHMEELPSRPEYKVTTRSRRSSRGSMIDRGANGGIAGNDTRFLAKSDRLIDVTGIDDHQMTDLRIGTAAGKVITQRGPAIVLLHEYALWGQGPSIHSSLQLEHAKIKVDERPLRLGGTQSLTSPCGHVIPLDVIDGLSYMKMTVPTDADLIQYPHITLTIDKKWNSRVYDCNLTDDLDWYDTVTAVRDGESDYPFDMDGEYKHLEGVENTREVLANLHVLTDLNERYVWNDDYSVHSLETRDATPAVKLKQKDVKYEELRPYFLNAPRHVVKHTYENTTQYATRPYPGPNMYATRKSPFPAMNVRRRNEDVATDTVYTDTPAIDNGCTSAQIFVGRSTQFIDVYPMKSDKWFVNSLLDVIRKRGAMDKLISDNARVEISNRVVDILRHLCIDSWQSESYMQWQNYAERRWQDCKRYVRWILKYRGVPAKCWYLVLEYVSDVLNFTAHQSLHWKTPHEALYGQTPDISCLTRFQFWDEVYFPRHDPGFPSDTEEIKGRWVGFSKNVGNAMTWKVLNTETDRVLERSRVRPAALQRNLAADALSPDPTQGPLPDATDINPLADDPDVPDDILRSAHESHPHEGRHPLPTILKVDPDQCIGRSVLMPVAEDGSRKRATILSRLDEYNRELENQPERIKFRVAVGDDKLEETVAYGQLMNLIESDKQEDGTWVFHEIISHQGPLRPGDRNYRGSSWNVLIMWETGEISWEPLSEIAQTAEAECALYAKEHKLLNLDGWKRFRKLAKRAKTMMRLVNQAKLRSFRTTPVYMYGYQVPRNHEQAMELDRKNGNTKWRDSEILELSQVLDYGTFNDMGKYVRAPAGYKKIKVHFVYAVKHDGRHKSRLVAGGHMTATPIDSVYSSVVSLRGVRMIVFLAELNDLETWVTDIGNAYLESNTAERVFIIAGPEFGPELEGHTLIIVKALYGLKSSGQRWWEVLADCLRQLGFFPSYAERDIWMRDMGDHYEYVVVYVDDLAIASKDPQAIVDAFMNDFGFKLKGTGPVAFHLGCDYFRDKDGVLCFAPKKYIMKMAETYFRHFGDKPKPATSPLEKGDHPELDTSEELDLENIKIYQSLIGAMQWAIQIGRMDITTAVMTMSGFRSNPRKGHLERCKRIYGYLFKMRNATIRFRTEEPDYSNLPPSDYDWDMSVYKGATEEIPATMPRPLGKRVVTSTYYDANLYHDMLTGRSVTGILHFFNKTPIDWFSKKQATVETATFGSEFVAGRTAVEQIIDLRLTLRYLGVPVDGPTYVFGDNKTTVDASSMPHARLHKRHTALSFHRVREAAAAGILKMFYIPGPQNPADILSKHWGYSQVWSLLQPLLFWEGDTLALCVDEPEKASS